jgi:hypothetical protein
MADEQNDALLRYHQEKYAISHMKFAEILHMPNAANAIWKFHTAVAEALSAELGTKVTPEPAGIRPYDLASPDAVTYLTVTFRVRYGDRKEARGMEDYIQVYTEDGPAITVRLFSYEEAHRTRKQGGCPIPVVDVSYSVIDGFDAKVATDRTFIDPYTHSLADWEKTRLAELTGALKDFCEKRNILCFSLDNFIRSYDN